MVSDSEYKLILAACRQLPRTTSKYLEDDYVMNLLSTVLDYQMQRTALANAESHYKKNHWTKIRNHEDVGRFLAGYPDTKEGNIQAAQYLWGNRHWTRLEQLRGLYAYFDSVGVTDQNSLREWARNSNFDRDFKGRVKGLAFAVYKWLVMRQGVATIKPDVHIKRFLGDICRRNLSDQEAVEVLERAAAEMKIPANELDWSIWDHERAEQ